MLMTVRETAAYLRIAESTVYDYGSRGLIPRIKIGRRVLFRKDDIDRLIADQIAASQPDPKPEPVIGTIRRIG